MTPREKAIEAAAPMTDPKMELMPCPFCGRTDVAQGSSGDFISVWCRCGARGPDVPFPEIGDPLPPILECYVAWNRRPAQTADAAEVMRLAEAWASAARNPYMHSSHIPSKSRAETAEREAKAAFAAALGLKA